MKSSCPTCLTMIEHADGASEVVCSCGTKFSPYLDTPASDETPAAETHSENSASTDFEESAAAFQDIRNFGETLGQTTTEAPGSDAVSPNPNDPNDPMNEIAANLDLTPIITATEPIPTDALVTTSEKLHGYHIDQYFFPLSIWFTVESESEDPLRMALNALWDRASTQGANGIVAVRWSFTPDGIKGVLCGTPVHLTKES